MKKIKMFYLIVVLVLLAISVVMFSGIAQAGAVPEGFVGVPWGASREQIIKTMSERGYKQLTNNARPNELDFEGDFLGVKCFHLYFYLSANSFYEGAAYGCGRSDVHWLTKKYYEQIFNKLNEKYGPIPRGGYEKYPHNRDNCKGAPMAIDGWHIVDSRSDKYSIQMALMPSSYYYANEAEACRLDIQVTYTAESLRDRLGKKGY